MNKRGTDKILSLYWFVLLTIIAGGVFAMVYIFYGAPYDVRGIEANLLAERVADCISRRGIMNSDLFSGKELNQKMNETFLKNCNINFNVENGYEEGEIQYLLTVDFYTGDDLAKLRFANEFKPVYHFYEGNLNYFVGDIYGENYVGSKCMDKSNKDYTRLVACTDRRLYTISGDGTQYIINIGASVGKSEKNVKQ